MYENGDVLLFALSAWRVTSWTAFKKCFDELHRRRVEAGDFDEDGDTTLYRRRALRVLGSLGHVDVSFDQGASKVVIAPPLLAALPGSGIRRAILCGARSPGTIGMVRKASFSVGARTIVDSQSRRSPYAPSRVEVQGESDARIEAVAQLLGIPYLSRPPARIIASISASVDEYCGSLTWSREAELDWYREEFDPESLRFVPPAGVLPDIRLSRYQDPVRSIWRHRLYRNGEFAEVDADWARYAVLAMLGRKVLRYDVATMSVLVPLGAPLPVLLSRALGFCSGYAAKVTSFAETPRPLRADRYETYQEIPPSIFGMITDKTGQRVS